MNDVFVAGGRIERRDTGRRDGIVVQDGGIGEMEGYGDASEAVDRGKAEAAVGVAAELFGRMGGGTS